MNCVCHGERMYWNRDSRYREGGFWRCAEKKRARVRQHYNERGALAKRRRYDADPIFRHEKLMANASRSRRKTIARRKAGDSHSQV